MVPLNAVIQYGHHHIFTRVSHLPGPHDVHVGLAVMDVAVAVLERLWQETRREDEDNETNKNKNSSGSRRCKILNSVSVSTC